MKPLDKTISAPAEPAPASGGDLPLDFQTTRTVKRDVIASHIRSEGEPFYYVAFANADNEGLAGLVKDYPLIGQKQYERHGYTLDLYTFRFSFKRKQKTPRCSNHPITRLPNYLTQLPNS